MIKSLLIPSGDLCVYLGKAGDGVGRVKFRRPILSMLISGCVVARRRTLGVTFACGALGYYSLGYEADSLTLTDKDTMWLTMFVPNGLSNAFEQNDKLPFGSVGRTSNPSLAIQLWRTLAAVGFAKKSRWSNSASRESVTVKSLCRLASLRRDNTIAENARNILHRCFRDKSLGLQELGKFLSVNPSHIGRQFKRQYGCTSGQYVRRLRVLTATEKLINHRNESLVSIAVSAGFYDQSHMCKAFKLELGVTPTQFSQVPQRLGAMVRNYPTSMRDPEFDLD